MWECYKDPKYQHVLNPKTDLVERTLLGKGNLDCLVMGQIILGEEDLEHDKEAGATFFILLKGIWPNLQCHSFSFTFELKKN